MAHATDPISPTASATACARQHAMHLIQATPARRGAGPHRDPPAHWQGVEQQHGFVHGGVVGMIADSAAGYAAMTMVPANASVLTVEFKMNLMAPADGDKLIARGEVCAPAAARSSPRPRSSPSRTARSPVRADAADHHGHARQGEKQKAAIDR